VWGREGGVGDWIGWSANAVLIMKQYVKIYLKQHFGARLVVVECLNRTREGREEYGR